MILQLVKDMIYTFVKRTFVLLLVIGVFLVPSNIIIAQSVFTVESNNTVWEFQNEGVSVDNSSNGGSRFRIFDINGNVISHCFTFNCQNTSTVVSFNKSILSENSTYIMGIYATGNLTLNYLLGNCLNNASSFSDACYFGSNFGLDSFALIKTNSFGDIYYFSVDEWGSTGAGVQGSNAFNLGKDFSFNLGGDFLAASALSGITEGVVKTGANLWPMFAFVGVSLAFIIALQVVVFTKRAVNGSERKNDATKYNKLPRTGEYKAFKRGRRKNKEDGIDLFPKN